MSVSRLREALEDVYSIFDAAGAKSQSKDLRAFLNLLKDHDNESSSEFVARLRNHLTKPKTRSRKAAGAIDQLKIDEYVHKLRDAGIDGTAFEAVMVELRKDKHVRKGEADAIASVYTAGRPSWPKKGDALKAIASAFDERVYQATKMRQVDRASRF